MATVVPHIIEETEDYIIYEAECPYDNTIKPRIKKLKEKKNETVNHSSNPETITVNSKDIAAEQG